MGEEKIIYIEYGPIWEEDGEERCDTAEIKANYKKLEKVFFNSINKLIDLGKSELAAIILRSSYKFYPIDIDDEEWKRSQIELLINTPIEDYNLIAPDEEKLVIEIIKGFLNCLEKDELGLLDLNSLKISIKSDLNELEKDWVKKLNHKLRFSKITNNQGNINDSTNITVYNNLKFRSPAEIEIAKELEKQSILYFPLPVAVVGYKKVEPDFLIQHPETKKFGILEVNGDTYHTPKNAQQDHERAEIFFTRGIYVKFVSAQKCFSNPSNVVKQFLDELKNF
jgi:hypothetical protein